MSENASLTARPAGRGITSNAMKIIAVSAMFLDHFAVVFGDRLYPALPFLNAGGFELLRMIGRIAFPMFAYMIAIGATYTKNIYKYMGRLLAFAFLSEIPFDLALFSTPFGELLREKEHQNVFFTLFLGLICIFVYEKLRKVKLEFLSFPFLLFAAYAAENLLKTDYGAMGVLCIFFFYIFMHAPNGVKQTGIVLTCVVLSFMLSFKPYIQEAVTVSGRTVHLLHADIAARFNTNEIWAVFSLPVLLGHKGVKGKKLNRWFFYAFYPAHLLLLWLISLLIG